MSDLRASASSPVEGFELAAQPIEVINALGSTAGPALAEWIRLELRRERALLDGARTCLPAMESLELTESMTALVAVAHDAGLVAVIEASPQNEPWPEGKHLRAAEEKT